MRVHAADVALLPGPGDIQDSVDGPSGYTDVTSFTQVINLIGSGGAVTLDGMNPSWILSLEMPTGQTYTAWSAWSSDGDSEQSGLTWLHDFSVQTAAGTTAYGTGLGLRYSTPELARAAFSGGAVTGHSSYKFFLVDPGTYSDNRGGLSIRVTKL